MGNVPVSNRYLFFSIFFIEIWLIYNVVLVSGIQQSAVSFSYTHTHTFICMYIYIIFQILFHYRLLQDIEYRSLCLQFPGGMVVKNPPANAADTRVLGLISGPGQLPGVLFGNHKFCFYVPTGVYYLLRCHALCQERCSK